MIKDTDNNGINVLSLFGGMECGMIALKELGVKINKYYYSEVDKFATQQVKHNFPEIIHLGSVLDVDAAKLPKIDLLIGGSPCQGFSFAGKRLNFDDPRSALFFEYVRILKECRAKSPNIKFLLENVRMDKRSEKTVSDILGLRPVYINSKLVSAQNRPRLYWSNIRTKVVDLFGTIQTDLPQPKDRGILLKDILQDENEIDEKYYLSDKAGFESKNRYYFQNKKHGCVTTEKNTTGVIIIKEATKKGFIEVAPGECFDATQLNSKTRRGRKMSDKSNTLMTQKSQLLKYTEDFRLRRLTPTECARLQTVPNWYGWVVIDTQQYKMLRNGWTIEVIKHIFSFLPFNSKTNQNEESRQIQQ